MTCPECAALKAELERRIAVLDEDILRDAFYCKTDELTRERAIYMGLLKGVEVEA